MTHISLMGLSHDIFDMAILSLLIDDYISLKLLMTSGCPSLNHVTYPILAWSTLVSEQYQTLCRLIFEIEMECGVTFRHCHWFVDMIDTTYIADQSCDSKT